MSIFFSERLKSFHQMEQNLWISVRFYKTSGLGSMVEHKLWKSKVSVNGLSSLGREVWEDLFLPKICCESHYIILNYRNNDLIHHKVASYVLKRFLFSSISFRNSVIGFKGRINNCNNDFKVLGKRSFRKVKVLCEHSMYNEVL